MGKNCSVLGWTSTLSAPLSSQLAAVLAGFVFTSIVFLISRDGRRHARTLGLFCAAFVILGFDSHLFSVLSGSELDTKCARVWTEGITASGLLGVGSMAIITGVIWLLPVGPLESKSLSNASTAVTGETDAFRESVNDTVHLNGIVLTMAYGVSVAVTVLLASTTYNYIFVVESGKVSTAAVVWILMSPVIVAAVALAIAVWRRVQVRRRPNEEDRISAMAFKISPYGILAYALAGTVFVGLMGNLGDQWFDPISKGIVIASIFSGLVIPGTLFVALIHAMPRLSPRKPKTKQNESEGNGDARSAGAVYATRFRLMLSKFSASSDAKKLDNQDTPLPQGTDVS
jgi:hypothetical protein